ncbi:MAG: hypothetical protein E7424_10040 [Ruminococcaceae bacterium]|nr:hypothetical protein [Oscillospiraceae bacterium]
MRNRAIAFLIIFVMLLGMLPAAFAADPEPVAGPVVVADPESPTGYIGQFTYYDPSAGQVYFCGDLNLSNFADRTDTKTYSPAEYKPGLTRRGGSQFKEPMQKLDGGYWYYELPLAAGANQYWFNVGSNTRMMPDPANAPKWSPNSSATKDAYNCVYVPYDEKQGSELLKAREAELPRETEKGSWEYVPYKVGNNTFYMGVYLPYGYDKNRAEPYKTVYLVHGWGQDESDWMGIGSVPNIMDNLIAEGRTESAVVISLPNNNNSIGSQNDKYAALFNTVLPFVEENYNVSGNAKDRALAGLSMGSRYTRAVMETDPESFGYYGLFSCSETITPSTPNLDKAHILIGVGVFDGANYQNATTTNTQNMEKGGFFSKTLNVAGAHDFNTWSQLLRMFAEDYLWKPWAFGDGEAPEQGEALKLGPNVIKDPDSPTGYTVKFLYDNPTATSVTFAGDIGLINWADPSDTKQYTPQEYKPGLMRSGSYTAPMEKKTLTVDGEEKEVWYYELPLAAGANQYWFYVDGNTRYMAPDPANHPEWSPNSSWSSKNAYNAVYVPYDEKQDFEPLKAREVENPREDQKGVWWYEPVEIGGRTHYIGVYLPYGYDVERAEPYKTIYTLHGGGQDESDWMGIGSVQNIMDNLAAEGRTEPAVIITPTTNNNEIGSERDNYANLFNVIVPYVEEKFNVSSEPKDRAFCGLSMGCTYTQQIANIAADKFMYFGPWSNSIVLKADAPNLDKAYFFFGRGVSDTGAAGNMGTTLAQNFKDLKYVYTEVAGAHDFNAWCQLFRMFLDEYLWNPAAFGDTSVDPGPAAELQDAIADAEKIDESKYTDESVAALEKALADAKAVLADEQATEDAVKQAAKALKDAIDALVEKPDGALFEDVMDPNKFYYDAVYWAFNAEPQITKGIDDTHFGPDKDCTRGQVVTFLWRAAGCPAPVVTTSSKFTDVKPGAFYELAVAWAVEKGITKGQTDTTFAPDATCTRGQIVTFLWRFKGEPAPASTTTPFTDVNPNGYYMKAVDWAVEAEITKGLTETTFGPDATCSRGQVVTFLYRATAAELAAPVE